MARRNQLPKAHVRPVQRRPDPERLAQPGHSLQHRVDHIQLCLRLGPTRPDLQVQAAVRVPRRRRLLIHQLSH